MYRFRDNKLKINWEEFDDYDTIFADTAMKSAQKRNKNKQNDHVMTLNDMRTSTTSTISAPSSQQSSWQSNSYPTPPPPPLTFNIEPDTNTNNEQLNNQFWNDIIDSASPNIQGM